MYEIRVSARKTFMGGGDTNLLKRGICLLNTFLKDFTKMPIKKNTVLQFDGGISPPCQNHGGDKSPPSPPPLAEALEMVNKYFRICLNFGQTGESKYIPF